MKDTSGFYKKLEDDNWIYAPNFVYSKDYTLNNEGNRQSIDGWDWYDESPKEFLEWERASPILNRLSPMIGMDQDGLDQFFISASKLK